MKKNSLYGLLNYLVDCGKGNLFESCGKLTHAITTEDKNYYRIDFSHLISTPGFGLKNAHLSIYEYYDSTNPTLSAAHFTAFYQVGEREYRLHLFLDENEHLLEAPHWHRLVDGAFVAEPLPENSENLCSALLDQGLPVFQRLRQNQHHTILELTRQYEERESIATELSRGLPGDKEKYIQAVVSTINTVRDLVKVSSNIRWPKLINYLTLLSNNVKQMTFTQPKNDASLLSPSALAAKSQSKEKPKDTSSSSSSNSKAKKPTPEKVSVKQNEQWLRFKANANCYFELNNKSDALPLLVSLLNQLDEVLLEEKISVSEHFELATIERALLKQTQQALNSAIVKGDYDTVKRLQVYSEANCFDKMNFALQLKKFDLARFLINELNFPVMTYPIDVKGRHYHNLLEYCFEHAHETPELVDLFANLINQGANLMAGIKPNGLPLAQLILEAEPKHPLVDALHKNADKTVENKRFYQQLIKSCEQYKCLGALTEVQTSKLDRCIEHYRDNLTISQSEEGLFSTKVYHENPFLNVSFEQ